MFVYQLKQGKLDDSIHDDRFELIHWLKIRDVKGLEKFSMRFEFKKDDDDTLIFTTQEKIFEFNIVTKLIKDVAVFK